MEKDEKILHHSLSVRLFHWSLVLGFLPAGFTGVLLFLRPFGDDMMHLAMQIHIAGAWIMTIGCVLFFVLCPGRVARFWQEIFHWTKDDIDWMKVSGGYPHKILLGREIEVPPMGKINSGQKLMGIMVFFGGFIIIITGLVLYVALPLVPKEIAWYADKIHLIVGIALFLCVVGGHIPLGIYNWPEFVSMFGSGLLSKKHAEKHHPLWMDEIEKVK
ncbi:cytochrome b/b6 domain-containing protein [Schwartzia succinivorans]|jgi:formate dehydrogenase subunit gamma|uniref:Formate dehydrogenase subunit gamma n=1 Tax=Schwartzia succinivorans DSM 10502 TaxID=1123243 RepID=A0A1M4ZKT9_9FIRM|nr:cytochrome b/b6 domain-containing protein [Schwartzia succinivorans]SHF18588.1 formate dehydrogenase subunit gamma [Schwartzia succinivorans DSM 10502]